MSNQQIQKVKVKHLVHVGIWSSDVHAQARFYHHALALDIKNIIEGHANADSDIEDTTIFLSLNSDQPNLGLFSDTRPAPTSNRKAPRRSSIHHIGFEVDTDAELAALAARLNMSGIEVELGTRDGDPDMSNILSLSDPDGNLIEIAVATNDLQFRSSPARKRMLQPYGLQHVAIYTQQLEAMVEFYTEALGFDISDWLLRECAWLRCNNNHHALILTQGQPGIDHLGFSIADGSELLRWADHFGRQHVPIIWGPGRHGAGHDLFLQVTDPAGYRVELSAEIQQYYDQDVTTPPRLWHTRSTALNLWGQLPSWIREDA